MKEHSGVRCRDSQELALKTISKKTPRNRTAISRLLGLATHIWRRQLYVETHSTDHHDTDLP